MYLAEQSIKSIKSIKSYLLPTLSYWPGISTSPLASMVENRDFLVKHIEPLFKTNCTHPGEKPPGIEFVGPVRYKLG